MAAPKGNQFWKARSSHGRKPIFETQEELWEACCEYFDWVTGNPLEEEKVFHASGEITRAKIKKMRAMTISGLCLFLDISDECWANYRKRKDFIGIVGHVEKVIYNQKFAGAAAELFNPSIIARELGLSDKVDTTVANPDGTNLGASSDIEIARKIGFVLDKALKSIKSELPGTPPATAIDKEK
jgi:hypothetical protein